jgi:ATP-dependent Clp protease ATP-binding subunit ClpX
LVKQYQRLLKLDGVDLEIREDALRAVAEKALARKTGARGLRSILENALLETMYELPSKKGVKKISVEASTILEGARPLYIYEEHEAEKSA